MPRISQEVPPLDTPVDLREYLVRRFIDIGVALQDSPDFPVRKQMPYKPPIGSTHYYGDPLEHSYDPVITQEGLWVFKST